MEMERPVTGWRAWLKERPVLFGYVYAGLLFTMVGYEVLKRSLPWIVLGSTLIGVGYLIGAAR